MMILFLENKAHALKKYSIVLINKLKAFNVFATISGGFFNSSNSTGWIFSKAICYNGQFEKFILLLMT